jgi:hypothetical protein
MNKFLKICLFANFVIVFIAIGFLLVRISKIESFLANLPSRVGTVAGESQTLTQNEIDTCGDECKKIVEELISRAVSTISATSKTSIKPTVIKQEGKRTAYIPLAGPITSTSTDWTDAAGTDVYIDLVNDYGKSTWVSWEAFLKIANGNGQAYARLYDVTHGIAVNGSEVSVASGVSTQVVSGELKFWSGKNLYRVQIKSLNSFVATFESGRIKINY